MKIRPKTANRQKKQKFKTIDPKSRKTTKIHGYFKIHQFPNGLLETTLLAPQNNHICMNCCGNDKQKQHTRTHAQKFHFRLRKCCIHFHMNQIQPTTPYLNILWG